MAENNSSAPSFSHHLHQSFPSISKKLDDSNYLFWQQVEPVIKSYKLHLFVANPTIPMQFLTENDRDAGIENPDYEIWEQQDQVLLTRLQSTLSKTILSLVLPCTHSYQVWEKILEYFHLQTRARAQQLRRELRRTMLDDKTMKEFLLRIKAICDSLNGVRDPVSHHEHVGIILEGLPTEYGPVIAVVESKFESPLIADAEALY